MLKDFFGCTDYVEETLQARKNFEAENERLLKAMEDLRESLKTSSTTKKQ